MSNKPSNAQQAALAAQQAAAAAKAPAATATEATVAEQAAADKAAADAASQSQTTADGATDAGAAAPAAAGATEQENPTPAGAVVTDTSGAVAAKEGDPTVAQGVRGVVTPPKPVQVAVDGAKKTAPAMPKVSSVGSANAMRVDIDLLRSEMERILADVPAANRMQINGIVDYVIRCDPSQIASMPSVMNATVGLWHNLRLIINNESKYFTKVFSAALRVFEIAGRGALSEMQLYRGMDNIPLSAGDRQAFQDITTMMRVLAPVKSRKMMLESSIKLSRSLRNGLTQEGINRVTAFFEAAQ